MQGVKMTLEEKALAYERNKEASRVRSHEYYHRNAEVIKEGHRKRYEVKKLSEGKTYKQSKRGFSVAVTMIDVESGERFEYRSVRSCSLDMDIRAYRIYGSLKDGIPFNGYKFER